MSFYPIYLAQNPGRNGQLPAGADGGALGFANLLRWCTFSFAILLEGDDFVRHSHFEPILRGGLPKGLHL